MSSSQKANFSLIFYISRTKAKKNGEVPVLMKININGNRVVMNLQRSINPNDWDSARARALGRTNEARIFNEYLETIRVKAHKKFTELLAYTDEVTPQMLRDAILGVKTAKSKQIIDIWQDYVADLFKLIGKEVTRATYQKHSRAMRYFEEFLKKSIRPQMFRLNQSIIR